MLDIGLETKLEARFRMALFNYEEDEVIALLNGKGTVVGLSDAGAHASQLCDACFSTYLMGTGCASARRFRSNEQYGC